MAAAAERLHPASNMDSEKKLAMSGAEASVLKSGRVASVSGVGAIPVKNNEAGPMASPARQNANPGAVAIAGMDAMVSDAEASIAFGYAPGDLDHERAEQGEQPPIFDTVESGEVMAQAITRDDLEEEVQRRIIAEAAVGEVVSPEEMRNNKHKEKTPQQVFKERATICLIVTIATVVFVSVMVAFVGYRDKQEEPQDPVNQAQLKSFLEQETVKLYDDNATDVQRLELSIDDSPQDKAFQWLTTSLEAFPVNTSQEEQQILETYALVTLFHATGGNNTWDITNPDLGLNSWMVGTDACLWLPEPKEDCNDNGFVQRLTLAGINMTKSLPLEMLFLTTLHQLNVAQNRLSGSLPAALPPSLQSLLLDDNDFQGEFPSDMVQLTNLREFTITQNDLLTDATLPHDMLPAWSNLQILRIDDTPIRGTIPTTLGNLTALQELSASRVRLSGTIPTEIGLLQNLEILYMPQSNALDSNLTGNLPEELWTITTLKQIEMNYIGLSFTIPGEHLRSLGSSLQHINFGTTRLAGTLPTELGLLTSLEIMELDNSAILGGTIPSEIGLMKSLRVVDMSRDPNLQGSLPTEVGNLANLESFWLFSSVSLTGSLVPSELGRCTKLQSINMKGTQHSSGPIPTEVGLLTDLVDLELLRTNMTGPLPSELGLLKKFEILTLGGKGITGTLPTELGQASSFTKLLIAGTNIAGTFPTEYGNLVNLDKFAVDRNMISGTLPVTYAAWNKLDSISVNDNLLTGTFPMVYKDWYKVSRLNIQGNNLTGDIGRYTCGGWAEEYTLQADCEEVECTHCCTHCCVGSVCTALNPEENQESTPGAGRPTGPQFFPPIRG
ncbi:LRR receptor-like serine threonine-protein kinase [Seminavis robusta]|uniref:LRR receptor-like serine threonine-protein kinase n=1 Tax=Seminavis robusta TaxID=568900 RepID=A0A9N8EUE4_9STRA|nr:LRR receptor-like serine threonine-protein kinase [Seminavis robusta]|eukprot:Sro1847_g301430.1 LRR receptor-like serine threonine-protein kinase (839) ;mRNA; r:13229-16405